MGSQSRRGYTLGQRRIMSEARWGPVRCWSGKPRARLRMDRPQQPSGDVQPASRRRRAGAYGRYQDGPWTGMASPLSYSTPQLAHSLLLMSRHCCPPFAAPTSASISKHVKFPRPCKVRNCCARPLRLSQHVPSPRPAQLHPHALASPIYQQRRSSGTSSHQTRRPTSDKCCDAATTWTPIDGTKHQQPLLRKPR